MTSDSANASKNIQLLLRGSLLVGLAVLAGVLLFAQPPLRQPLDYHHFADDRTLLGIPHCANVVSNLPFLFIGLAGCWFTLWGWAAGKDGSFRSRAERWPYLFFFLGVGLTAFGSAYYHLAPDNPRLVWDRLPLAVAFMALFSGIIGERIQPRLGTLLLGPLILVGISSVLYWGWYDDLRPYYLVQFYPLLAVPALLLLFPARYTGTGYLFLALACYAAAKVCEHPYDEAIYEALGRSLSGHTIKHVLAALGAYWILFMLQRQRAV